MSTTAPRKPREHVEPLASHYAHDAAAHPDAAEPWFGAFELAARGKTILYKVGHFQDAERRIVHYLRPLGAAYYEHRPGDELELELNRRLGEKLEGKVLMRAVVAGRARRATRLEVAVEEAEGTFVWSGSEYLDEADPTPLRFTVAGLPEVAALLTPAQYSIITRGRGEPLVIQGRAGSGKTSVAIYRVAYLTQPIEDEGPPPIAPERVLTVMYNTALREYVRGALDRAGLGRAELDTFREWSLRSISAAYRGKLAVLGGAEEGAAAKQREVRERFPEGREELVASIKKQSGMLRALEAYVRSQEDRLDEWMKGQLLQGDPQGTWRALYQQRRGEGGPVVRALRRFDADTERLRRSGERFDPKAWRKGTWAQDRCQVAVRRMTEYKGDLRAILTDVELLAAHLPAVPREDLEHVAAWQRAVQGEENKLERWVCSEDLALLLRLIQLKNGGLPRGAEDTEVVLYDHLLVDEAQDFGATELAALFASVRTRSGVTVAGDLNQKINPKVEFMGWEAVGRELGVELGTVARLDLAHRCTGPIMRLADRIAGDTSPTAREGVAPMVVRVPEERRAELTAERVSSFLAANPSAHACVVVRHREQVPAVRDALAAALEPAGIPVRLGRNESFVFAPGVTVTNLRQVKGLEFDYVLGFGAGAEEYPDSLEGRRNLYTLVTRARERLDFVHAGELPPLLEVAIARGLLSEDEPAPLLPAAEPGDALPL